MAISAIHLIPGTKINMVSVFRNMVCSGVTSKNSVCASETVTWHDLNENDVEKNIYSKDRKEILARFRLDKMDNFRKLFCWNEIKKFLPHP